MHDGFILNAQLCREANVSTNLFRQINCVKLDYMGKVRIVKKSTLPDIYKQAADRCIDLKSYTTASEFARLLGMNVDYVTSLRTRSNITLEVIKVGGLNLVKLSEEFLQLRKSGFMPFLAKRADLKDETLKFINMNGLNIGFY